MGKYLTKIGLTKYTTKLKEYISKAKVASAASADNATKVNNHTVNSDVPANAKFTDTDTWRPQPDWNATSGDAAIKNKPTIPSVGDGTITIKQNGTSKGTFTTNQSGNTTIELTDNNTWRGIQDNLTSTSTTDSLSANQGRLLANGSARDNTKLPLDGGTISNDDNAIDISPNGLSGDGSQYIKDFDYIDAYDLKENGVSISEKYANMVHTHDDRYYTETEINTKLNAKLNTSLKGAVSGLAELDANGKVPSSQLPSYVDDVIEGYFYNSKFYKESAHTTVITGETGKIYIDLSTNKTYRWSGSAFIVVSETLALGETSSTAYRGDRGKTAYDHSQSAHAPSNAQANVIETVKVNGTALTPSSKAVNITVPTNTNQLTNGAGYITSSGTAKTISDTLPISKGGTGQTTAINAANTLINSLEVGDTAPTDDTNIVVQGVGNYSNKFYRKPVSLLWNYIKSKLATVATSGNYNDLSNKPTIPSVGNGTVTIKQNGTTKGSFTMNQSGNTTIALTDTTTSGGRVTVGAKAGSTIGQYATAEGNNVTASGNYSHAEGNYTTASEYTSHAEGDNATASGSYSHAEGNYTRASGIISHASGCGTHATRRGSHSEGLSGKATGVGAHVEGTYAVGYMGQGRCYTEYDITIKEIPTSQLSIVKNTTGLKDVKYYIYDTNRSSSLSYLLEAIQESINNGGDVIHLFDNPLSVDEFYWFTSSQAKQATISSVINKPAIYFGNPSFTDESILKSLLNKNLEKFGLMLALIELIHIH